jgi:hypothetical protein|tara:strand:+ start:990 stop:1184 length:195 start_codon:yes stop_codon:yes gene_type:complete
VALPTPKRNEAYTAYVSRMHKYVKRNKQAVRGIYKGRGKNRKLDMPALTKKIGASWRRRPKKKK